MLEPASFDIVVNFPFEFRHNFALPFSPFRYYPTDLFSLITTKHFCDRKHLHFSLLLPSNSIQLSIYSFLYGFSFGNDPRIFPLTLGWLLLFQKRQPFAYILSPTGLVSPLIFGYNGLSMTSTFLHLRKGTTILKQCDKNRGHAGALGRNWIYPAQFSQSPSILRARL